MDFDSSIPIRNYPEFIKRKFIDKAEYLKKNLLENYLHVVLIPAPYPCHSAHMIRCVDNENPEWYKDLYHSREYLKRSRCLDSLTRISTNNDFPSISFPFSTYDSLFRELIYNSLIGNNLEGEVDSEFCNFFKQIPF